MPGKSISRRTFLQGAGTVVALPFLDAMIPAFAGAPAKASPTRLAFCYVPNGIIMDQWLPGGVLESAPLPSEFPRVSRFFAPYRQDILMFDGLTCNGGRSLGDGPGDHGRAGASYLTASHPRKTAGKDIFAGVSVDQIAAKHIGDKTRFASLELGCEEGVQGGSCDSGYSCAYTNNLAWRTPTSPLAPEIRPRAVFERMFGAGDYEKDPVKRAQAQEMRGSMMDAVLSSAQSLRNSLGPADRRKLDEYMFAVRDIEKRIEKAEKEGAARPPLAIDSPAPGVPETFEDHSRLMFDLMTVAMQTDMTRVITLLMAVELSGRAYREIGISEGHHSLTHHMGDKEKIEKVTKINEFHAREFVYFLEKLKNTPDGDGSLLDHSMIVYGSGISDGNRHQHDHVPTILAGRGNGTLKPGRFVKYPDETPLGNLWVSLLARMGAAGEKVGDSNGELPLLTDL